MDYRQRYEEWLNSEFIDTDTKESLRKMEGNEAVIRESFYTDLEFGTGGLRGIIGPGTNRINKYTVQKATQGLANYISHFGEDAKKAGVAIAYDSRHYSQEFAEETALVLNANGIRTYLFRTLMPTPILSYAVRELGAKAGVVITASHNPPQYNGYKVYWEDGGQIVPELAEEIISEMQKVQNFGQVQTMSRDEAEAKGYFQWITENLEEQYIGILEGYSFIDDSFRESVRNLKVIFTPLHGAGNLPVRRILGELGFEQITVVPEQELPDPTFRTVKKPNPEEKDAFRLAIQLAEEVRPDIIIGTDPDCDRVGVVEKTVDGQYAVLTGNQVGVLLTQYVLSRLKEKGKLPKNGVIVKTIVTTEMAREIAGEYGVALVDTLTGFKFIGEKIKDFFTSGQYEFILGFEESYGYLIGTHARDKDGVVSAAMICEMAAYYRAQGRSLTEELGRLMEHYGFYLEKLISIDKEGIEGLEQIAKMMRGLHDSLPENIGTRKVISVEDYLIGVKKDLQSGEALPLNLPKSDVLKFWLDDRSSFTIRPSGTEPKVKIYLSVVQKSMGDSLRSLAEVEADVLKLI